MENLKIIHEKENPLFSRKEVIAEIKKSISPKRADAENSLAEKFSVTSDRIKVDRIIPKFGSDIFIIYARIYKSKEDKDDIEPKVKTGKPIEQNAK